MGITNFDIVQANSFLGAGSVTQGNVYYVKPYSGNDDNDGKSPQSAFKTLVKAQLVATADQNDIVYLFAESNSASLTSDYQSTSLVWAKDGVHLIGVGSGAMLGQRARVAVLSTVKDIDIMFSVTADNCYIANVEFFYGVASCTSAVSMAVSVSGMRNKFENCQISGIGDTSMDDAGARSLYISGSENIFKHCYIGLETVIRGTAAAEVELKGTSAANVQRNIFEDCMINTYTSSDSFLTIKTTYVGGFCLFKNCIIAATQTKTSATAPAAAIANTTPNGAVYMFGSSCFGFDNVVSADDSSTLMSSFAAGVSADEGLAGTTTIA